VSWPLGVRFGQQRIRLEAERGDVGEVVGRGFQAPLHHALRLGGEELEIVHAATGCKPQATWLTLVRHDVCARAARPVRQRAPGAGQKLPTPHLSLTTFA
jgi:hypothetical protein